MDISTKNHLPSLLLITLYVGFSALLFFYFTPELFIKWIGAHNAYVLIFILSFLGGLTTFSGVPYQLYIVSMAMGGLNPLTLGLTATAGVMLGDSTSYYVGYRGHTLVPKRLKKMFKKIYGWGALHPGTLPVFYFLYGAIVPLSNDFITISAGLFRYPFWRVIIPLGLGNLIFNISIAFLSTHA